MAKSLSTQLKRLKAEQVRQREEAVKNTSISRKKSREDTVVVKEGTPNDHTPKHSPQSGVSNPKVGASIGVTLNMGDYESMRIDCWLTDEVKEGETFDEAFSRVLSVCQAQVDEVAQEYR